MSYSSPKNGVASNWMLESLREGWNDRSRRRGWAWAAVAAGCLTGCATVEDFGQAAAQPFQAGGDLLARAGDRVSDAWESRMRPSPKCPNGPATQSSQLANRMPNPAASTSATQLAGHTAPAASGGANQQASAVEMLPPPPVTRGAGSEMPNAVAVPKTIPSDLPAKALPAAPGNPEANSSRAADAPAPISPDVTTAKPISLTKQVSPPAADIENVAWCRVRVRNASDRPATQVAVSIIGPQGAELVSHDGNTPAAPSARMDFAAVPQVGPGEEVVLIAGVLSAVPESNRVRVQVRDAQGGTHQEVQARWQVTIEPIDEDKSTP